MDDEILNKLKLLAVIFIVILGITHVIEGFLAIGLLDLSVTVFIYGFFLIPIGFRLLMLLKKEELDEKKQIIIFASVVIFLNGCASLIFLGTTDVGQKFILYGFIVWHLIVDIYVFPVLFISNTILDKMDTDEKIGYFSNILIRGLGLNYLFQILAQILPGLYYMIVYLLIFGIINLIIGNLLYLKKENKQIQILSIILLTIGGIIAGILFIINTTPNLIMFVIFHVIILVIRIYYIKRKF